MTDPVILLAELIADAIAGNLTQPPNQSAIAQAQTLGQLLRHKFQQDSEVESILTAIEKGSRTNLDQLVKQLKLAIQQDATFAAQAQAIVQSLYPEKLQISGGMTMAASGNAQAFQTKVEGGTAYVGNNYIVEQLVQIFHLTPQEILALESFWVDWSQDTEPFLSPDLVIGGREQASDHVLSWLRGSLLDVKHKVESRQRQRRVCRN